MFSRNIFILCGRHKTSFAAIYIIPLSFPGKITEYYIAATDFIKLMCHARKSSREEGFLRREMGLGNLLGQVS